MSKKNQEMEVFVSKEKKLINDISFSLMVTKSKSFIHLNCLISNYYSVCIPVSFNVCFDSTVDILYNKHLAKILTTRSYIEKIGILKKNKDQFTQGFTLEKLINILSITKIDALSLVEFGIENNLLSKNAFYCNLYHFK